jgi:hypothetical protein
MAVAERRHQETSAEVDVLGSVGLRTSTIHPPRGSEYLVWKPPPRRQCRESALHAAWYPKCVRGQRFPRSTRLDTDYRDDIEPGG